MALTEQHGVSQDLTRSGRHDGAGVLIWEDFCSHPTQGGFRARALLALGLELRVEAGVSVSPVRVPIVVQVGDRRASSCSVLPHFG